MQLTKNIASYEVLPKDYHNAYGNSERAVMRLMDKRIVLAYQWLIGRFGTFYFNNWYWNGNKQYRGFRPPQIDVGAQLSQHKYGRAIDGVPKLITMQELHKDIVTHPDLYLSAGFTTFEAIWDAPTWLHGDCRWHNLNGLLIVDYSGNAYSIAEYKKQLADRKILK